MSVISGILSEAEVHENLQALHLRGQVRVQCFRDAREASARQERRSLGYLSGLRDNKSFLLESAARNPQSEIQPRFPAHKRKDRRAAAAH